MSVHGLSKAPAPSAGAALCNAASLCTVVWSLLSESLCRQAGVSRRAFIFFRSMNGSFVKQCLTCLSDACVPCPELFERFPVYAIPAAGHVPIFSTAVSLHANGASRLPLSCMWPGLAAAALLHEVALALASFGAPPRYFRWSTTEPRLDMEDVAITSVPPGRFWAQ